MKGMCDICGTREGQRIVIVTGLECWVCDHCSDNDSLSTDVGLSPSAAKEIVSQPAIRAAHEQAPALISPDSAGDPAGLLQARLSDEQLFRIGPQGLEDIGDQTLELRVEELEAMRRRARQTVAQELNTTLRDITLSQRDPCKAV